MVRRVRRGAALVSVALLGAVSIAPAQTPETIFNEANAAYEDGRYEEAAKGYRSLLRYRINDARVEYNLGNAEFRKGNLGQAILHYERARRLAPVDQEIRGNLEYARSLCFDRVEAPRPAAIVRWFHTVQNHLGPDRQAWIALSLIWLAAGLVAWCGSRRGGWNRVHGWLISGMLVALIVSGTSWHATLQRLEARESAVVLDEVAEVLAGPGYNNPGLFTVHEGLTLEIRARRDEWLQVSLPNGLSGWIAIQAVGQI